MSSFDKLMRFDRIEERYEECLDRLCQGKKPESAEKLKSLDKWLRHAEDITTHDEVLDLVQWKLLVNIVTYER